MELCQNDKFWRSSFKCVRIDKNNAAVYNYAHCHYLSQIIDINRFDSPIIGKERGASYFTIHLSMFLVSEEKFTPML